MESVWAGSGVCVDFAVSFPLLIPREQEASRCSLIAAQATSFTFRSPTKSTCIFAHWIAVWHISRCLIVIITVGFILFLSISPRVCASVASTIPTFTIQQTNSVRASDMKSLCFAYREGIISWMLKYWSRFVHWLLCRHSARIYQYMAIILLMGKKHENGARSAINDGYRPISKLCRQWNW